jgi:hypothetical protein
MTISTENKRKIAICGQNPTRSKIIITSERFQLPRMLGVMRRKQTGLKLKLFQVKPIGLINTTVTCGSDKWTAADMKYLHESETHLDGL